MKSRDIQVATYPLGKPVEWVPARRANVTAMMRPMPAGYVPVRFPDGARLLIHHTQIRIAA